MELKADIKQVNVLLRWRPPHAQSKRRHPGHRVLAVVLVAAWLTKLLAAAAGAVGFFGLVRL